jgi:ABC-type antimicrobial peptide transport system permease subunit
MSLQSMRNRLPLAVFIIFLIFGLLLLGFACACLTDHPAQAIERALSAIPAVPATIEIWPSFALALALALAASMLARQRLLPAARSSPAVLQRFLF